MKIKIKKSEGLREYEVSKGLLLLQAMYDIKENQDSTLSFDSGCRSSICGECAVRVNGKEVLACATRVNDGDVIEPLQYHKVIRDLRVDKSKANSKNKIAQAFLHKYKEVVLEPSDEKELAKQSDCILCDSCYSACPVMAVNENFLGPFALTRAYRYAKDRRESEEKSIIDSVQNSGVWDCTLCGECTLVCPKGIDPKADIIQLRNLSAKYGYMDPNFGNMGFGGDGFGFNPNGF